MAQASGTLLSTTLSLAVVVAGCQRHGQVNQGQVIAFDRNNGMMVVIQDSNYRDSARPKFDVLPPLSVRVPADKQEMGPAPEPGRLLNLDLEKRVLTVYEPASQGFKLVDFTLISRHDGAYMDDPRVAKVRFPQVDVEKRTITIYHPKQRRIVTISVAEELMGMPADTWRFGDEVRYYYKDPGQALRLMNITKTDVTKAGK